MSGLTLRAKQLFDVYFTHLHPYLPMLDKEQSAPGAVARRNNFLFNASEWDYRAVTES